MTNSGTGAVFSATIQLYGLTAGAVQGRQIFGMWELASGADQRLATGETRTLRLTSIREIGGSLSAWTVHRAAAGDIHGIERVEFMEVRIADDPDLVDPCQLQVLLDTDSDSKMARVGKDPALFHHIPQRVGQMRRVLAEIVDYVRGLPREGITGSVVWMAVTVHQKVPACLLDAVGIRTAAHYQLELKAAERGDLVEFCTDFLLRPSEALTEDDINPSFRLPTTWREYYEAQPGWDWPDFL